MKEIGSLETEKIVEEKVTTPYLTPKYVSQYSKRRAKISPFHPACSRLLLSK